MYPLRAASKLLKSLHDSASPVVARLQPFHAGQFLLKSMAYFKGASMIRVSGLGKIQPAKIVIGEFQPWIISGIVEGGVSYWCGRGTASVFFEHARRWSTREVSAELQAARSIAPTVEWQAINLCN